MIRLDAALVRAQRTVMEFEPTSRWCFLLRGAVIASCSWPGSNAAWAGLPSSSYML